MLLLKKKCLEIEEEMTKQGKIFPKLEKPGLIPRMLRILVRLEDTYSLLASAEPFYRKS